MKIISTDLMYFKEFKGILSFSDDFTRHKWDAAFASRLVVCAFQGRRRTLRGKERDDGKCATDIEEEAARDHSRAQGYHQFTIIAFSGLYYNVQWILY